MASPPLGSALQKAKCVFIRLCENLLNVFLVSSFVRLHERTFAVNVNSMFLFFLSLGGAITPKGFSTDCGCFKTNRITGSHSFDRNLEIPGIIGLHHPKPLPRDILIVPRHWIWKLYIPLYFWINQQTKTNLIDLTLAIDYGHPPAIAPDLLWPQGLWPFWRPLQTDTWKEGRGQRGLPSGGNGNQKPIR